MRLHSPHPYLYTLKGFKGLLPGDMVDLNWRKERRFARPHVEDGSWEKPAKLPRVSHAAFVRHLEETAFTGIFEAFGPLYDTGSGGNLGFEPGRGARSLATLKASGAQIYADRYGKTRVRIRAEEHRVEGVPLNDLNLTHHLAVCRSCKNVASFGDCLLRIGLGRPFAPKDGRKESCWLQVNGIFPMQNDWPHFYQEPAL